MDLSKIRPAVKMARKVGMADLDILVNLLQNEGPPVHRREIVEAWAKAVGLDSLTALRRARAANLIPTTHPAKTWNKETLQHKVRESSAE
jgi:hypothetical protein